MSISFASLKWDVRLTRIVASAFGVETFYFIEGEPGDWSLWTLGATSYVPTPGYETQAAAKAAAQVDFNRRVFACLEGVELSPGH